MNTGENRFRAAIRRIAQRNTIDPQRPLTLRRRLPPLSPAMIFRLAALIIAAIIAAVIEGDTALNLLNAIIH